MYHKGHSRDPLNVEASDRNILERSKPDVIGSDPVQVKNIMYLYEIKIYQYINLCVCNHE
jgi:hypothetical protein